MNRLRSSCHGCRRVPALALVTALIAALIVPGEAAAPDDVRAAMLVWRIGIDTSTPPSHMVEAITSSTFEGRRTWRSTHYAADPTSENGTSFDLYDVDAETLLPIRSVMHNATFRLSLLFGPRNVTLRRVEGGKTVEEQIPVSASIRPEGPGRTIHVASLPLEPGYTTSFQTVDRWSGKEGTRVKAMTLSVAGRRRISTAAGMMDTLEVITRADDGSFRIVDQVRVQVPHYPWRVEYTRGTRTIVSDVTAMTLQGIS